VAMAVEPECVDQDQFMDTLLRWLNRAHSAKVPTTVWTDNGVVSFVVTKPYSELDPHVYQKLGVSEVVLSDTRGFAVALTFFVSPQMNSVRWHSEMFNRTGPVVPLSRYEDHGGPTSKMLSLLRDIAVSAHESCW
jgi:hypothetical protein